MRVGNWIKRLRKRRLDKNDEAVRSGERSRLDQLQSGIDQLSSERWRLKSYIAALIVFLLGLLLSWAASNIENGVTSFNLVGIEFAEHSNGHHLIRDVSITAMITAVLIAVYELGVKNTFIHDVRNSLKSVHEEQ